MDFPVPKAITGTRSTNPQWDVAAFERKEKLNYINYNEHILGY